MLVTDLAGLRINTVDSQSRRRVKIRLNGGFEINIATPYVRDSYGQDLDLQRLVGGFIVSASIQSGIFQLNVLSRLGHSITLNALGTSVSDNTSTPITADPRPSLYLGQIATNSRIPNNLSTSNKQFNSRSRHVLKDSASEIYFKFPSWYWSRKGTLLESPSGGSITYSAAVEKDGTFTKITFNGSETGVSNNNSDVIGVATGNFPEGEIFVRTFGTSTTSIVFTDGDASPVSDQVDDTRGEAMEFAASGLTDKTMGGTITASVTTSAAPVFSPTAIFAQTRKPSIFGFGDSRAWGYYDNYDGGNENLGEIFRTLGKYFGYINAGSAGDNLVNYLSSKTHRLSLAQYCSHIASEPGVNDLRSGGSGLARTAEAVLADLQTAHADFAGKTIIRQTISPSSSSTTTQRAQIAAFNDAIRAGLPGVLAFVDVADVVEVSRNSGTYKPGYSTDQLHLNPTGYAAVETSGVWNPALITRQPL